MAANNNQVEEGTQVHITFESRFHLNAPTQQFNRPTELALRKLFIKFGTIVDVSVKEYVVQPVSTSSIPLSLQFLIRC